jgi:hypothetical protein
MGRFVASTATVSGFSQAQTFTSSGTWTVPPGITTAKVFVIGAGSCYRTTCMCFQGLNCCSGVVTPVCRYCMIMVGHLPGAGGGYAEKTMVDLQPGTTMTITVGSIGGSTASIASIGSYSVTANNATESAVNWACTNNSTARNNSSDNPVSMGFSLPTCGYVNCIWGYWNFGGTASGGDVNRTGGRGVIIPYVLSDSVMDGCIPTCGGSASAPYVCNNGSFYTGGYDYSFGGTRYNCVCVNTYFVAAFKPNAFCGYCFSPNNSPASSNNCYCDITYHTVFGNQCANGYWSYQFYNCLAYCACGMTLCVNGYYGGGPGDIYYFAGQNTKPSYGDFGSYDNWATESTPVGIGAESGTSAGNGNNAVSEVQLNKVTNPVTQGGGYTAMCAIGFSQDNFTFVFGSSISSWPVACYCNLFTLNNMQCYNMGFFKDESLYKPVNTGVIPLSTLKQPGCANISDFRYGYGATTVAAGYGGGGNRLNPAGGNGAVVIMY